MIFASLASGSSGNCTLLATEETQILIDCGVSAKRIDESLRGLGFSAAGLSAVFLTHEHTDHIKGLKRLMSAYGVPVYAAEGTLRALPGAARDDYFRYAGRDLMYRVSPDERISIGSFSVLPFAVSHDAAAPLAYRAETETDSAAAPLRRHVSAAVMTDSGYFDDEMRDHLLGLDVLLIEANHDRAMLSNGPYPMSLKRRIMSRKGHLSNNAAGQLLSELVNPRLMHVFLGHLSRENNTPELALETVRAEVKARLGERTAEALSLSVAPPDGISEIIRI